MKKTASVLLACLLSIGAMAGGFSIPEQGSKAAGLAGAFTGLANDPSAIYFNPAGISFIKGMNLTVGSTFVVPEAQYQDLKYGNQISKQKDLFFAVPQVFFTYQWEYDLTFGGGIYAPFGLGTEWEKDWSGDHLSRKIDLKNVHFGGVVSYKVMDNLSVAGTFAWSYAIAALEKQGDQIGHAGDVGLEGTGSGIHWGVSALYKPLEMLSIGMSYRAATELEITGDIEFTGDRTAASTDLKEGKGKVVLPIPSTLNVGVAVAVLPELMVTADYNWSEWSKYEKLEIENTDKNIVLSSSPRNWSNTSTYRVGAEYTGIHNLALRVGFLRDSDPVETKYSEPSLPDAARTGYTVGAGYRILDNLSVDAYLLLLYWDEKKVSDNEFTFNGYYNTYATLSGVHFTYNF
ncbi:MAG: outer membrane protein transport protein [Bacteroidetes bacterium]|nr:outer membrane protein transport protein [Bacteroidota bacterium]